MALQFLHSWSWKGRNLTTHGSTKAYLQHGLSQSAQMAGLQIRLASNGSTILRSTQDKRQLGAKGSLFLTTMEAIQHQSSGHSVKTIALSSFGCLLIPHTSFNHWMLAALVLWRQPFQSWTRTWSEIMSSMLQRWTLLQSSNKPSLLPSLKPMSKQGLEVLAYIHLIQRLCCSTWIQYQCL